MKRHPGREVQNKRAGSARGPHTDKGVGIRVRILRRLGDREPNGTYGAISQNAEQGSGCICNSHGLIWPSPPSVRFRDLSDIPSQRLDQKLVG